jgi:hypothetical protein
MVKKEPTVPAGHPWSSTSLGSPANFPSHDTTQGRSSSSELWFTAVNAGKRKWLVAFSRFFSHGPYPIQIGRA